jgi:periplasmic protein TonB
MSLSRVFILTILICCNAFCSFSQKSKSGETFYAFDKDWKAISNIEKATYFSRTKKVSDTCWVVNTYNVVGPMISKEVYKDKEQKIAHGSWIFYKRNGYMDSICTYKDNLAHGSWYYMNDTGRSYLQKDYENGRLKAVHDLIKKEDSAKKNQKEPKLKEGEESVFPGRANAWANYLNKNLEYPQRALNAKIAGMVVVQFIVNTEGVIEDIDIYKSVEFSLDEESVRMIAKSPPWEPAVQDGKRVKSYKRQPIVFGMRK